MPERASPSAVIAWIAMLMFWMFSARRCAVTMMSSRPSFCAAAEIGVPAVDPALVFSAAPAVDCATAGAVSASVLVIASRVNVVRRIAHPLKISRATLAVPWRKSAIE